MDINIRLKIDFQDIMKILLDSVNFTSKIESNSNKGSNNTNLKKAKSDLSSFSHTCDMKNLDIFEKVEEKYNTNIFFNPLKIIIDKELREAIAKAQQMLSQDHKQVIQLRSNGMTARQISEMAGISEADVNSMFYKAVKEFKKNFRDIYNK
ncbi:RNA polymerase sigma factor [Clostridium tyrobutyricum]|uniref:RNA polymerase sigma factor n=1 Tax=Clostridium tyrobutyricum TaxID=1519 RepID=UPI00057C8A2F|nr:sigma-70 family RNA polymerase sigma factor [Clostridium tyrobutyricum]